MSGMTLKPVKAHVSIECENGITYEIDLEDHPLQQLVASLSIETESVEKIYPPGEGPLWREYEPGPRTGEVTISGRVGEARRVVRP